VNPNERGEKRMPSATVDQMVVQVMGAGALSVLGVVWLWMADVHRWWPFNFARATDALLEQRVVLEPVQVLTAARPVSTHHHHGRRQRAGLRWAARVAGRVERRLVGRVDQTRRGLRRGARELILAI
jgi:hypothetical protein